MMYVIFPALFIVNTNLQRYTNQGTVMKFDTEKEDEKIGIIVTGDCDIAQNKHGKYLSYCNIISLDSYIRNYFIQKKL